MYPILKINYLMVILHCVPCSALPVNIQVKQNKPSGFKIL